MRALLRIVVLAGVAVLLTASPAAADPAKPGQYKSTISSIEPVPAGVKVEVIGGDSFLQVTVDRGHEVVVYTQGAPDVAHGEAFLRIRVDGVVEENMQSPYTYSIQTRYGTVPPQNLNPSGPPQWSQVATGGVYAWHDHRIHWMSPTKKPGLKPGDIVQTWTVPLDVDGKAVTVAGSLVLADPISPVPWFGLALVIAGVAVFAGRGKSTLVASLAVLIASAGAVYVGLAGYDAAPERAGGSRLEYLLPAVALVAALVAVVLHRKPWGVIATLLSVACLGGWAIQRIAVLFEPVLPTNISYNTDRAGTAIAIGAGVAAAVLAVRSGGLVPHFADLVDDDDEPP